MIQHWVWLPTNPTHPLAMAPIDPIRLLAENCLLRLLSDLPAGTPAFTVQARLNGLGASLRIGPPTEIPLDACGDNSSRLTSREREVLDAVAVEVARLGRRVLGSEVRAALKAAGIDWGVSTVNTTLADLVAVGRLVNDNDKRGYGLADDKTDR